MSKHEHHEHHIHHHHQPGEALPPEDAPAPVEPAETLQTEALPVEDAPQPDAAAAEIEALRGEIEQLKTAVLRERADGENLRKRLEREALNASKFASEQLLKDLLPTLDALTLGLEAARQQAASDTALAEFVKGTELTLKTLLETLQKHGIEELNPLGEKLNPEQHQALSIVPNPEVEPNTIVHVAQKGYVLNGRVVRAAQVIVAGKPA